MKPKFCLLMAGVWGLIIAGVAEADPIETHEHGSDWGETGIGPDTIIGPGDVPAWAGQAQVRLGWVFGDPLYPSGTDLIEDPYWNQYIGEDPPEWTSLWQWWDGSINDMAWEYPGTQLHIALANLPLNAPKRAWLSVVYKDLEHVCDLNIPKYVSGTQVAGSEIVNASVDSWPAAEPWNWLSAGRTTTEYEIWGGPAYEEFWVGGTHSGGPFVTEVYVMTHIIPEPATWTLLGLGLAGLAFHRFRNKAKT